jgi:mRNA interferase RelE/StbE
MPNWRIVATSSFVKDFRNLSVSLQGRILKDLEALRLNPYSGLKLTSTKAGKWRIRIGNYRIRYDIIGNDIILHRVRHRSRIYGE